MLVGLFTAIPAIADETRRYDVLTSGRVVGFHVTTVKEDGSRVSDFEFNDRGRGPKLHETIEFDARGRVRLLNVSGHAYMGAGVEEQFQRDGDHATWRSTLERGERTGAGRAFYLAADGTPEHLALLARALLRAPENRLPVLPTGAAAIEQVATALIGPSGEERDVALYAISGLDLTPSYLWLDEDLELFGNAASWMGLVPEGWGDFLPSLIELQSATQAKYFEHLAHTLTRQLPTAYVIQNARVVDVDSGAILDGLALVVRNGRIESMGQEVPKGFASDVLDAQGGFLLPGLWDMHTHMGIEAGMQHIAGGVTTVRDLGNNPHQLLPLRERFDAGEVIGPRVIAAGVVEGRSEYSAPLEKLSDTEQDAVALVQEYAGLGYAQIKVYSSVPPAWVEAIAAETHRQGMRLSGHIPNGMTAEAAVRAGFDEIQHINMLFLNFLAGPEVDTRTPQRFSIVAEQAASLDLDSRDVKRFLKLLAKNDTVIDPTLAIFEGMLTHVPGEINPGFYRVADHFPASVRRALLSSRMVSSREQAQEYADDARALFDMLGRLHDSGIRIVAGTDGMPGFLLHRELELYVQAGIPAAQVLRLATLGAAEVMGLQEENGSIEVGKHADLVLVQDNPLKDTNALRRARLVIKGQRAWKPAELHRAMGIQPFTDG